METVRSELELSAEQMRTIEAALAEARREARSQFSPDMTPEQRRQAFARIREENMNRIAAMLTEEQRTRFAALRERLAEEQRGGGATGRVYIVGPEGQPQAVTVRLGASDGSFTEILGRRALPEGAAVIVGAGPRPQGRSLLSYVGL